MLRDKVVLITGASSGIGAACAKQFAQVGANVLLCARRLDRLEKTAEALRKAYGVDVLAFPLDIRDNAQIKRAITALPESWKRIDILINNAGLSLGLDSVQAGDVQNWDVVIDTNLKGLLYMTRSVLPDMVERDSGHIINIGSIAGHQIYPNGAVYCATKHAVDAFTRSLRLDLFGTKIRVSTVDPGLVHTNFSLVRFEGDVKRADAVYSGANPLQPEDVADSVLYCATRPPHVNISEVIIMPTSQASVGMTFRESKE